MSLYPSGIQISSKMGVIISKRPSPGPPYDLVDCIDIMNTNKEICYIKAAIRGKLQESDLQPCEDSDACVEAIISMYLVGTTYKSHVATLCTDLRPQAIDVKKSKKPDAQKVAEMFKLVWKKNLSIEDMPDYVNIKENCVRKLYWHRSIIDKLIHLSEHRELNLYLPLVQLLSLAYWLVLYFDTIKNHKNDKVRKLYNLQLHYFLYDYVITFILLLSRLFPQKLSITTHDCIKSDLKKFPEIIEYQKEFFIHTSQTKSGTSVDPSNRYSIKTTDKDFIQQAVKDRLTSFHQSCENNDVLVEAVVKTYLLGKTYNYHVASYTSIPIEGITLQRLHVKDAQEVAKKFKLLWESKLETQEVPHYILIQKEADYVKRLQLYTARHTAVTRQMVKILEDKGEYVILVNLLSLAYWLVLYHSKIKEHQNYNQHVHHFLSDLVIMLILLLSKLFPLNQLQRHNDPLFVPGIVETTIEIESISTNFLFKELVLIEMCQILGISPKRSSNPADTIIILIQTVHQHLIHTYKIGWSAEHFKKIIIDQARYIAINTTKGTVSSKNISNILNAIKYLHDTRIDFNDSLETEKQTKLQEICKTIFLHKYSKDEHQTPAQLSMTPRENIKKFYHAAFVGIVLHICGTCPKINRDFWISIKNFMKYSRMLAKEAIQKCEGKNNSSVNYHYVAKITVALREIIAARYFLNDMFHKEGGIISNSDHKRHKEVLIHFIAFRALLMYVLPLNPSQYGEQAVAKKLPKYASDVSMFI